MTACASCGLSGHRYGRNEGAERYDPMACINSLRGELERLREAVADDKDYDRRSRRYLILNDDGHFMWVDELMEGDRLVADRLPLRARLRTAPETSDNAHNAAPTEGG